MRSLKRFYNANPKWQTLTVLPTGKHVISSIANWLAAILRALMPNSSALLPTISIPPFVVSSLRRSPTNSGRSSIKIVQNLHISKIMSNFAAQN
jgi:hypothetical protein